MSLASFAAGTEAARSCQKKGRALFARSPTLVRGGEYFSETANAGRHLVKTAVRLRIAFALQVLLSTECTAAVTVTGTHATAATAAVVEPSSPAARLERWRDYIDEAAIRFGVPAAWIERVMLAESGGRTMLNGRPVVSSAGAMGLMQLMPGTWAEMRRRLRLGHDPHAPRDNILAGTLYLRLMYDRFGYPGLFGAYNAGPARYAAYLRGRQPLPAETRHYLGKVAGATAPVAKRRGAAHGAPAGRGGMVAAEGGDPDSNIFFIRR